jgi:lipoprotein-releasing system ATP-binding protein
LHILGGLDRPTRGEVTVSDVSLTGKSEKELARFRTKRIGFVFQFHYLLDDFTALENVMIPMLLNGEKRGDAARQAELILDQVGLIDRKGHRPKQLSGGEQQRVAVARALANEPDIVLADEPSGNLDTATGRKLHDLLFHLNSQKSITFLIATHNEELAERCDRRLTLVAGKVAEEAKGE